MYGTVRSRRPRGLLDCYGSVDALATGIKGVYFSFMKDDTTCIRYPILIPVHPNPFTSAITYPRGLLLARHTDWQRAEQSRPWVLGSYTLHSWLPKRYDLRIPRWGFELMVRPLFTIFGRSVSIGCPQSRVFTSIG